MGMTFSWRGCSLQTIPQLGEDPPPPVEDPGLCDPLGNRGGSVGSTFDSGPMCSAFPPVLRDWVIKGLGMSSLVYATGHIKDGHGYSQSGSAYKQCCNAYSQSGSAYKQCCDAYSQSGSAHKQCCNAYLQSSSAHKQCENGLFAEHSQNFNLFQK